MIQIKGNYKIDEHGNIYSFRGMLNSRISKGGVRVSINQKWVSKARVIATYLVPNPYFYDRILFVDCNPLNCHPNNIIWVSEEAYRNYIYSCQMKGKIKRFDANIEHFKKEFEDVNKQIYVPYWKHICGYVYIKTFERYMRGTITDIKGFVLSRLEFYYQNFIQYEKIEHTLRNSF